MDIYEVITEEHNRVQALLDELKETTDRAKKTRSRTFAKIVARTRAHMKAEEKLVFPILKDRADELDDLYEFLEEHRVNRKVLGDIAKVDVDQPEWKGRFNVLSEFVRHHHDEEEDEMFEMLRDALEDGEADSLGLAFAEKQAKYQAKEKKKLKKARKK